MWTPRGDPWQKCSVALDLPDLTWPQFLAKGGRFVNHTARVKRTKDETTPWADCIPNRTPRKYNLDTYGRSRTISLHSHMGPPDSKRSTYFLERGALREIRQSNRHVV